VGTAVPAGTLRRYRCYAKVNLTLEVLGKRADGYHDLASLAHTISLGDDLRVAAADEIVCRAEGLLVEPEANLVVRAAELLRGWTRLAAGAELTLEKRIPVAAGLGGGSSDAATTLVALNSLWGAHLRSTELSSLAARLGSDVPFFVRGGAAVLRGTGTELELLAPLIGQWLALAVPPHTVSNKTAALYAALRPSDYTDGQTTRDAAARLAEGAPLGQLRLHNAFGRAARELFPGLSQLWRDAEAACGRTFHLSGAGPTLFAMASDRQDAQGLQRRLAELGLRALVARTVAHARASASLG
jgi:4-diphosphocytidyl-2-C-methyl-D-erythritol kinase